MRKLIQSNSWRQEVEWQVPVTELGVGNSSNYLLGVESQF